MILSEKGRKFIQNFEGLRLEAYLCPSGVWTIGFGHTAGVKKGQKITLQQAESFFNKDIFSFENAVNTLVKVPLTQGQFDALVSFAFNCGIGNFRSSTLLKLLNQGDYKGAGEQFLVWNKIKKNGKLLSCEGLTNRRKAEKEMFILTCSQ